MTSFTHAAAVNSRGFQHDPGLSDATHAIDYNRIARLAAAALQAPCVLIVWCANNRCIAVGGAGLPNDWSLPQQLPADITQLIGTAARRITDTQRGPGARAFAGLPSAAYCSTPLFSPHDTIYGGLIALDSAPHHWSSADLQTLHDLAALIETDASIYTYAARMRLFADVASDAMYAFHVSSGGAHTYEWVSPAIEQISGYTIDEWAAPDLWQRVIHPDDATRLTLAHTLAQNGQSYEQEYRIITKAGEERLLHEYGEPEWDLAQERVLHILAVVHDITDSRRATESLRISDTALQALMHAQHELIFVVDRNGRYCKVSALQPELIARAAPDVLGKTFHDVLPSDLADAFLAYSRRALETQQIIAYSYTMHIKEIKRWFLATIAPISEDMVVIIVRDVQAQYEAEAALRESEERYRLITEHTNDLISIFDANGCYVYASPSFQTVTGYDPSDLIGIHAFELIHSEDQVLLRSLWEQQLRDLESMPITIRYRHADSSWRWCDITLALVERNNTYAVLGIGRDVTERKRLEDQLQHAQKMESIGRLAGGVAHDFNNLLAAIIGYADLVQDSFPPGTPAYSDLNEIQKAARRAATLTRQLLAFARRQIFSPQRVNLSELIIDMDKLLRRLIGEDIELITLPATDLKPVRADPGQIEQVLANLAINARDAMPDGGKLFIETVNIKLDTDYAHEHIGVQPGDYALLLVSDTGHGMSDDVKRHLFEPFFTTKEQGKGTGLGLAMCYGIVKQHGGNIWAYSEIGIGTTIKVYLPCISAGAEAHSNQAQVVLGAMPFGNETILLVEDEDTVRTINARVLRAQGYTVLEASNGDEAMQQILLPHGPRVDLLLTDVVMPRMGGKALAAQLAVACPHMKVLFTSGYSENLALNLDSERLEAAFIEKPATPAALVQKVRDVLDS